MITANEKSQFNDAVGFLKRLDESFRMANYFNGKSDLYSWYQQLNIIFSELINFVPKKEREEKLRELMTLKNKIDQWVSKRNSNPKVLMIPSELYWDIFKFHLYMKQVYGDSGLETKMLDDAMKALK